MIESSVAFASAKADLERELASCISWLRDNHDESFVFQFAAGTQTLAASKHLMQAIKDSGNIDPLAVRFELFSMGGNLSRLLAFRKSNAASNWMTMKATLEDLQHSSIGISLQLLRSLVERVSLAFWLRRQLVNLQHIDDVTSRASWQELINCSSDIGVALYGTRLDWRKIAVEEIINIKDADYEQIKGVVNLSAKNVLTRIDLLSKSVKGLRIVYEILCEFTHPNVGDLYSSTTDFYISEAYPGPTLYFRKIGTDEFSPGCNEDIARIFSQIFQVCASVILMIKEIDHDLKAICENARSITQHHCRVAIKKWRSVLRKSDFCICGSAKRLGACCGRGIPRLGD